MGTNESFPAPARGVFEADEDFIARGQHMEGFNNAIQQALESFNRTPRAKYPVHIVLSATVEETTNPGRITEYIATVI
jgi:hypothetical protein